MGDTGGDNRAEFDWRAPHAIWYESPIWSGLQFSAMFSPGQNYAKDNSDFAYGDFNCPGSTPRGTGSGFWDPNIGTGKIAGFDNECTDGSYGNLYSAAFTYKNGPFTAMAAYELHEGTNPHGDDGLEPGYQFAPVFLPDGSQVFTGVHNERAVKVGGGYQFKDPLGPLQLYAYYEWLRRDVSAAEQPFNERSRDGVFASLTQTIDKWSFSFSYIHAFNTPGAPACLSLNNPNAGTPCTMTTSPTTFTVDLSGQFQHNRFDESTNQYNATV